LAKQVGMNNLKMGFNPYEGSYDWGLLSNPFFNMRELDISN
jgi:hypothetical protein